MPRNGSGTYSLPAGSIVSDGQVGLASQHNTPLLDITDDLNDARPIVAGGTEATTIREALSNLTLSACPVVCTVGGTLNVITLTTGRSLTALTTGMTFVFEASTANDSAVPVTINIDGIGAKATKTITGAALPADYIRTDAHTRCWYDLSEDCIYVDRLPEYGSNADGRWVRTADGIQNCWGGATTDSGTDTTWTYPKAFSDTTFLDIKVTPYRNGASNEILAASIGAPASVFILGFAVLNTGGSRVSRTVSLKASGRWYAA